MSKETFHLLRTKRLRSALSHEAFLQKNDDLNVNSSSLQLSKVKDISKPHVINQAKSSLQDIYSTMKNDTEKVSYHDENSSPNDFISITEALKSLEKALSNHTDTMLKRIRQERTNRIDSKTTRATPVAVANRGPVRIDKVCVKVRVVFLKIGEIDTLKENFVADCFIQARWHEPKFDNLSLTIEDFELDNVWNPKLYVENSLGDPKESVWIDIEYNEKKECNLVERRRIKGCFLENLELGEFPFDTQDLTLTVTSERSEAELDLEEDSSQLSGVNVQSFVDEQEWRLHTHVETWKRMTKRIYQNSRFRHPAICTSCRASRRPGFFVWNIFLVMLFICSLAFATFTVELKKPENRLQLSFLLLLTTITFKFVVSQTLPKISYLTYLDKYILTSMAILCIVCVWHAVVPLMNYSIASKADIYAFILLTSGYFLFHLSFFLYIYFLALRKRWKNTEKDRQHKERIRKSLPQIQIDAGDIRNV